MHYYQAEIRSQGLAAEVRVNDLPVYDNDGARGGGSVGGIINDSIVNGRNTVSVVLGPAQGRPAPAPGSLVSVQIREARPGVGPAKDPPAPLYAYYWKMEGAGQPLPRVQGAFESQTRFGTLSWQRAAPVTLDAATEAGVRSLIERLHRAMQDGDVPGVMALLAVKARDGATASGLPQGEFLSGQEDYFRQEFAQPGWKMRPLDAGALRFRLYGGGRVVGVTDARGQEALRSLPGPDGVVSGVAVYASLLDGQWTITR